MANDFSIVGGFVLDTEGLARGAQKATKEFNALGTRIAQSFRERIVSTIGAAGIAWALKKEVEKAHKVAVESAKMGISTEEFQTLQHLAERTGSSVEKLSEQFIEAKASGTDFAKSVGDALQQLRDSGSIMTAEDVANMARAYESIAQLQAKAAPLVSDLATAVAGTITDVSANPKGILAGLWQNTKDWAKLTGGSLMEWMAGLAPEGSAKAEEFRAKGYNLRRSVTERTNEQDIAAPGTSTETPLEKLIRELQQQTATDAWWKAIGGDQNWSSSKSKSKKERAKDFEVSSLTGIGGYMQSAPSKTRAETTLELINRKMDDLVSAGRKMSL